MGSRSRGPPMTLRWRFTVDCRYRFDRIGAYRDRPTDARHRISGAVGPIKRVRYWRKRLTNANFRRSPRDPIDLIAIVVLSRSAWYARIRLEMTWRQVDITIRPRPTLR